MALKLYKSRDDFIKSAIEKYGDKFDYSNVKYINSGTKVEIICKRHGPFQQTPSSHIRSKYSCKKCRKCTLYTQESWIEYANIIHDNKYDYSKTMYTRLVDPITIICPRHGEFRQLPKSHLRGYGCKQCSNDESTSKLKDAFIQAAKLKHGDKYDYSLVNYKDEDTDVMIICKNLTHGIFVQKPRNHLTSIIPCNICRTEHRTHEYKSELISVSSFMNLAVKIFGDTYDYSSVEFKSIDDLIIISCPNHGPFYQTPRSHIYYRYGCSMCHGVTPAATGMLPGPYDSLYSTNTDLSIDLHKDIKTAHSFHLKEISHPDGDLLSTLTIGTKSSHKFKTNAIPEILSKTSYGAEKHVTPCVMMTKRDFINQAKYKHNNFYDYKNIVYINANTKINIACPSHGIIKQSPMNHLIYGCLKCLSPSLKNQTRLINSLIKKYGSRYDYSRVEYLTPYRKIEVVCKSHGPFLIIPYQHIKGKECRKCRRSELENACANVLDKLGIDYKEQQVFVSTNGIYPSKPIKLDFIIKAESCIIAIELDGKHQFTMGKFNPSRSLWQRKNQYCKDNNIHLLRISYSKASSLEDIIREFINKVKCTTIRLQSFIGDEYPLAV